MIEYSVAELRTPSASSVDTRSAASVCLRLETSRKIVTTNVWPSSSYTEVDTSLGNSAPPRRAVTISVGVLGGVKSPRTIASKTRT